MQGIYLKKEKNSVGSSLGSKKRWWVLVVSLQVVVRERERERGLLRDELLLE
jgi:hypothetical protein